MITVTRSHAIEAGGCNFCSTHIGPHGTIDGPVFIIESDRNGSTVLRFCENCLRDLAGRARAALESAKGKKS